MKPVYTKVQFYTLLVLLLIATLWPIAQLILIVFVGLGMGTSVKHIIYAFVIGLVMLFIGHILPLIALIKQNKNKMKAGYLVIPALLIGIIALMSNFLEVIQDGLSWSDWSNLSWSNPTNRWSYSDISYLMIFLAVYLIILIKSIKYSIKNKAAKS